MSVNIGKNSKIKKSIIGNNNKIKDRDNIIVNIIITIVTGVIVAGIVYFLKWN